MTLILPSELARFAPHGTVLIADSVVKYADTALPKWHINTAPRLQMFMAHCSVESAGFSVLFEDMDYSAARMRKVWPDRFPSIASAQPYAHSPEKLADFVYGGRMGNTGPMDGWYCRGQGLLQLTGMTAFQKLAKAMDITVDECRAMLTAPETMLECAAATFSAWGLLAYADQHDLIGSTRALNGGLNGLADREAAYSLAKRIWPTIRTIP